MVAHSPAVEKPSVTTPANSQKFEDIVFIGHTDGPNPHRVHTVLTTRKDNTVFQGLIRYQPEAVPLTDVSGLPDVLDALARQNKQIPQQIVRVDQETEALVDNLGEPLRSITSYHAYLNPIDGRVIAYDLAMTTGGQPQRFAGHITRAGITVEVYYGGNPVDHHEIPFPMRDTFILPVEMEFINQWYQDPAHKDVLAKAEPVKFSMFIPEVMGFVLLVVKPLGSEVIPVQDATYNCARYDVLAVSTQSTEGLQARQNMWFDKRNGLLMKREDYEASLKPGEAPVMQRMKGVEDLAQLRELIVRAPKVPDKPFPYALDQDLLYTVHARDAEIGRLRIKFSSAPPEKGAFMSRAHVTISGNNATRNETALTYYDANWRPLRYEVEGTESADVKANYTITTVVGHERIDIDSQREIVAPVVPQSTPGPAPEQMKKGQAADEKWQDPLVRVPVSDKDAEAVDTNANIYGSTTQKISRALDDGVFLYDFNRIEQLATLAHRFPHPPAPAANERAQSAYQKAAIFSVRQNRAGVLLFEVKPEPKPALTERQKHRLTAAERNEPALFVASAAGALLPCKMLLTADGRLLELSTKHGTGDVTYTLDDPIMRGRAERVRKQQLQEGPQLIRPPWW